MALNIKDDVTDRLARALASETGESITVATKLAIEQRLARVRAHKRASAGHDELHRIVERGRRRRMLDDRPEEEILGYDEHGLPA